MKIAIIGLGLIGGSWALALRDWSKTETGRAANLELIGFDAKGKQRSQAEKMGLCHRYTTTPMEAVKDANIVIIATPVMAVRETFEDIADHLAHGAIVTDTCSTKRQVMLWAKEILPRTASFIGGHPMAGKTASLEEAEAGLFKNCTYCLMSAPGVPEEALDTIARLVEVVGAKPYFVEAAEHDSYVAAISHLPYLAAVSLVNLAGDSEGWREIARLASTGFQDTTRLASGNLNMYLDICRTNSDSIIAWLDRYQQQLDKVRQLVEQAGLFDAQGRPQPEALSDPAALVEYIERARATRDRWQSNRSLPETVVDNIGLEMPSKSELGADYSRMLFGGLFSRKKRPNSDKGTNDSAPPDQNRR